ncbi:MAG: histidine--tRNA ligase [Endomicrobium sp.]|jgi:histidyl-tRNA synthetase|nr:histidine--tRNA ligase [Endomicrobium sp.]
MNYKAPRGTHDIFLGDAMSISFLEFKAKEILKKYGFEEIRTPIFEDADLFVRSIGSNTDIVEKEMYIFEDKKGRKLALRPEGTASLVRAFIEHKIYNLMPTGKFFYIGEMFRYERPQLGRYRQFHQIGAEFFGNSSPSADAEMIILAHDLLSSIGINNTSIYINSLGCEKCRPHFRNALIEYFGPTKDLCNNCCRRLKKNPLRLLDCKIDSYKFINIPQILNYLCIKCRDNFDTLQVLLKGVNCSFNIDKKLVRGLDYYTQTVFEIRSSDLESKDTLIAGGRYDNLIKELGGPNTPAVGFALGSQRVLLVAKKQKLFSNLKKTEKILIAIANQELFSIAFSFAIKMLRNGLKGDKNISVFCPKNTENLTNQLKFADKIKASKVIIFAKDEFKKGKLLVKNMHNGIQSEDFINNFF